MPSQPDEEVITVGPEPPAIPVPLAEDHAAFLAFLDELEARQEELNKLLSKCYWNRYLGYDSSALPEVQGRVSRIMLNPDYARGVAKALGQAEPGSRAYRRLLIHHRNFLVSQVAARPEVMDLTNQVTDTILAFQYEVGGKKVSLSEARNLLRTSSDRQLRREAYLAGGPLAKDIAERVRELIRLRRAAVAPTGYPTAADLAFSTFDMSRDEVVGLFSRLEQETRSAAASAKEELRAFLGVEELKPWDVAYALDQMGRLSDSLFPKDKIVPQTVSLAQSLGFAVDEQTIRFKFAPIPYGGLCMGMDPPEDIRILMNPQDGLGYYMVAFHEYGHALSARYSWGHPEYALRGAGPGPFAEGMAVTITEIVQRGQCWLRECTDAPQDAIAAHDRAQRLGRLTGERGTMGVSVFEVLAYDDPEAELNALWRKTMARFTLYREEDLADWAAHTLFTTHPLYYPSYVLANTLAAQTVDHLEGMLGSLLGNKQVARFLTDNYYAPGRTIPWMEKVERATGQPLEPEAMLRRMQGSTPG